MFKTATHKKNGTLDDCDKATKLYEEAKEKIDKFVDQKACDEVKKKAGAKKVSSGAVRRPH